MNLVKIKINYTSNIYDEVLGDVEEDTINYKKGDPVFALLDFNSELVINDNHLIVPEKYVLKLNNEPKILPLFKYGTIIYNIIKKFDINSKSTIEIVSDYNIFFLLSKYIKKYTNKIIWIHDRNDLKYEDLSIIIQGNEINLYYKKYILYYNLNEHSIYDIFGIENVKEAIEYSIKNNIYADISYIHTYEIPNFSHNMKKCRFIDIISFLPE
jgi:hypothetical protein